MLKQPEINRLVNDYIGVSKGYLNDFNYRKHDEFYRDYCDLEINVDDYRPGTTKETFIRILEASNPLVQAQILKGVFKKIPVSGFEQKDREKKQGLYDEYQVIIARLESGHQGACGDFKNLIFAVNGPKPDILLEDAITNKIKIVENKEYCLVYDRPLTEKGLLWRELVDWWRDRESQNRSEQPMSLTYRLLESMKDNQPETLLFNTYYESFLEKLKDRLPALIPQVYLHYDPSTGKDLKGEKRLVRQRMDFLLLLPHGKNIVIEIDGKQHYSEKWQHSEKWQARPDLYAEMVAEDRRLKLTGYEVYRFGGYELQESKKPKQTITDFFSELFKVHYIS